MNQPLRHPLKMCKKYTHTDIHTDNDQRKTDGSIGDNTKSLGEEKNIIHKLWHISHINYLMINFDDRFFIFIACMLSCSLSCTFYIWNRCLRAFHLVSTMFGAIICGRQNNSTNEKKRKIYIYAYKQRDTHTRTHIPHGTKWICASNASIEWSKKCVKYKIYMNFITAREFQIVARVSISVRYLSLFLSLSHFLCAQPECRHFISSALNSCELFSLVQIEITAGLIRRYAKHFAWPPRFLSLSLNVILMLTQNA